jgi:hypothetical protein
MDDLTNKLDAVKINVDIMDIIEPEDKDLLINKRIINMSRNDWGKTIAVSNQYIQRNILRYSLEKYGYKIYEINDRKNNSPGYDLIIETSNNNIIRVQSKLRQVNGKTDFSQQIHFETTRRNSIKNKNKNHTGHICYSLDEFDLVMISIVNDRLDRSKIKNCNEWSYCLIPIKELEDKQKGCCLSAIPKNVIENNIINIEDDIRVKLENTL